MNINKPHYAGSNVIELRNNDISPRPGTGKFYCNRPDFAENPHYIIFYAPWCGHCTHVAPTMVELANKMLVGAVNTDIEKDATNIAEVKGYPTIYFFKNADSEPVLYNDNRSLEKLLLFKNNNVPKVSEYPLSQATQLTPDSPEWKLTLLRRALYTAMDSMKHSQRLSHPNKNKRARGGSASRKGSRRIKKNKHNK